MMSLEMVSEGDDQLWSLTALNGLISNQFFYDQKLQRDVDRLMNNQIDQESTCSLNLSSLLCCCCSSSSACSLAHCFASCCNSNWCSLYFTLEVKIIQPYIW